MPDPLPPIPIDQVKAMRQQGLDNNQIIQALQRDGYSSAQIFDALSQSEEGAGSTGHEDFPNISQNVQDEVIVYPQGQGAQQQGASPEELIESIIDEKWNELLKDITKIVDWKNETEGKMGAMQQELKVLREDMEKLRELILGKVGEYDKNILDVGADVKAMEKVFSKFLPTFAENVSELSRVADTFKSGDMRKEAPIKQRARVEIAPPQENTEEKPQKSAKKKVNWE
ncbi:MAG: hypothetical protein AABX70_07435 [Nanoarchaeota archaeon]